MRVQVIVGSLLAAGAVALLSAGPAISASADDPVDLGGAYVLDRAGVLEGDTTGVREAIDRLFQERGTQLFVVYVDEFTGTSSDQDWANETAIMSGLGDPDILLAIATDERIYRYSVSEAFPMSTEQLDAVAQDTLSPALRDDDWAGAVVAYADRLSAAQAPSPVPLVIGAVAVAGVGTAVIVGAVRRRSAKRKVLDAAKADIRTIELRAGKLLVGLDDALKTSEQELGFAQAQFGDDQIRDFQVALTDAKATAKQAFEIQHKLDDAFPETPEQHRAMILQLIGLAERADATLDAQSEKFEQLRRLDENAAEVLEQIAKEQAGLAARIDAASETLDRLAVQYPTADLGSVAGLPGQARKLTGFAATAVRKARAELAKPKGEAAVAVRAAQQAVGQVGQLLSSVDTLASDLAGHAELQHRAAAEFERQLQRSRSQVSAAQDYITTHRGVVGTAARTRVSEAHRHLEAAVALAADDPSAMSEAQEADTLAVAALHAARTDVAEYEQRPAVQEHSDVPEYQEADGASLGGILSDLFFGSGSGGSGGSGGGGWSWGGSSGSGGWSSSRPSGFGGSGRRSSGSSRRGSGSSSGGRRGGGGRF